MLKGHQKMVIIFVVGFFIGGFTVWVWLSNVNINSQTQPEEDTIAEITKVEERNTISVFDQQAGLEVIIEKVILDQSGWVAIHEDADGVPGTILGAQLFGAGEHAGVVELLRGTEEGKLYYAMIHYEDGDRAFNIRKDTPLLDSENRFIMVGFNVKNNFE